MCVAGWGLFLPAYGASDLPKANISIISNVNSIGQGTDVILGVRFKLPEGWETYWRTPGEAGYPARFNWTGSDNLQQADVLWPWPQRVKSNDLISNVYEKEVIFPVKISLKDKQKPLSIKLHLDYLLCQPGSCVPVQQKLDFILPAGEGKASENTQLMADAMKQIPHESNSASLSLDSLKLVGLNGDGAQLRIQVNAPNGLSDSTLFVEGVEGLQFNVPTLTLQSNNKGYFNFTVKKSDAGTSVSLEELLRRPLILTLVHDKNAIAVSRTPEK